MSELVRTMGASANTDLHVFSLSCVVKFVCDSEGAKRCGRCQAVAYCGKSASETRMGSAAPAAPAVLAANALKFETLAVGTAVPAR